VQENSHKTDTAFLSS